MTKLTYFDADTNEELHSEDLGALAAGLVGFSWNDLPQDLIDKKTYQNRGNDRCG